jgi:hypothetical protein
VSQYSRQMVLDHLCQLHHRSQEVGLVESSYPAHPAAPNFETMPRRRRVDRPVDVLEHQPYLIRLGSRPDSYL